MSVIETFLPRLGQLRDVAADLFARQTAWSNWLDQSEYGYDPSSQLLITDRLAVTIPAVYSAARIIAEMIASCPLKLRRRLAGGGSTEAVEDDLYWMMLDQPNNENTAVEYLETLCFTAALRGESFAFKKWGSRYNLQETYFLHPDRVRVQRQNGILIYRVADSYDLLNGAQGPWHNYTADEVMHFKLTSFDGVRGISPLSYFRGTFGMAINERNYMSNLFANGAAVRGLLTTEAGATLSKEKMDEAKAAWQAAYGGTANAGRTPFLPGGVKFQNVTLSPVDVETVAIYNLTIADVARIFRVPLHLLAQLERSTNNNIEQQSREFLIYTLQPWFVRLQKILNKNLLTFAQQRAGYFFEFDTSAIVEGDSESTARVVNTLVSCGVFSVNEGREKFHKNPVEGGDQHKQQMQMVDITANPAEMQQQQGAIDAQTPQAPSEPQPKPQPKGRSAAEEMQQRTEKAILGVLIDANRRCMKKAHATFNRQAEKQTDLKAFDSAITKFLAEHEVMMRDVLTEAVVRGLQALGQGEIVDGDTNTLATAKTFAETAAKWHTETFRALLARHAQNMTECRAAIVAWDGEMQAFNAANQLLKLIKGDRNEAAA